MMTKHMFGKVAFVLTLASASAAGRQTSAQSTPHQPADLPTPTETISNIQDAGRFAFLMADENNDGRISKKEAVDAANLGVGGLFFRADANGDGTLSQDEVKQARESFLNGKPWLRYFVATAKSAKAEQNSGTGSQAPMQMLASVLDSNNDKQLQATELRQLVQTAVDSSYATIDTDRDGQLTPAELNAAVTTVGRMIAQAEFQKADSDSNGQISQQEFTKAIQEPSQVIFKIADLNNDGQISEQEAQTLRQLVASKIQVINFPEPANSPTNTMNRVLASPGTPAATTTNTGAVQPETARPSAPQAPR